jgi:hypothetical protein
MGSLDLFYLFQHVLSYFFGVVLLIFDHLVLSSDFCIQAIALFLPLKSHLLHFVIPDFFDSISLRLQLI